MCGEGRKGPENSKNDQGARYLDEDTPHLQNIDSSSGKREAEGSVKSNTQSRGGCEPSPGPEILLESPTSLSQVKESTSCSTSETYGAQRPRGGTGRFQRSPCMT